MLRRSMSPIHVPLGATSYRSLDLNLGSLGSDHCSRGPNAFGRTTYLSESGKITTEWNHCLPYHVFEAGCIRPSLYPKCFPPFSGIELSPLHQLPLPPVLQYVIEPVKSRCRKRFEPLEKLHSGLQIVKTGSGDYDFAVLPDQPKSKKRRVPPWRETKTVVVNPVPAIRKPSEWKRPFRKLFFSEK